MARVNLTANSAGTNPFSTRGASVNIIASGTWGSGTLAVQIQDGETSNWVTVYSNTANFAVNLMLGSGAKVRYVLTGSTAPNLNVDNINVYTKDLNL